MNPSSLNLKQKKELYAKALAQELKAKGYDKIEYVELGEGCRDITINNTITLTQLSEEDLDTIDILYQTLISLNIPKIDLNITEPEGSLIFEGIEIIIKVHI